MCVRSLACAGPLDATAIASTSSPKRKHSPSFPGLNDRKLKFEDEEDDDDGEDVPQPMLRALSAIQCGIKLTSRSTPAPWHTAPQALAPRSSGPRCLLPGTSPRHLRCVAQVVTRKPRSLLALPFRGSSSRAQFPIPRCPHPHPPPPPPFMSPARVELSSRGSPPPPQVPRYLSRLSSAARCSWTSPLFARTRDFPLVPRRWRGILIVGRPAEFWALADLARGEAGLCTATRRTCSCGPGSGS